MTPPSLDFPAEGRLLGIDYGTVRIGIAVCDPSRRWVSPLENYTRQGVEADARHFRRVAQEHQAVGFVVGLPLHTDGAESPKSQEARQFAQWLTAQTELPCTFQDERYTSHAAEHLLAPAELGKKGRKKRLDMIAAQLILDTYLQRQQAHPSAD